MVVFVGGAARFSAQRCGHVPSGVRCCVERGYVVVDERGIAQREDVDYETSDLAKLLKNIVGKTCAA